MPILTGTPYDYKYKNAVELGTTGSTNTANTSTGGWAVTDKIFGYLDKVGELYNDIRYPRPGDVDYVEADARLRVQQAGVLGLPKPWGTVVIVGFLGLLGWGIYTIAKPKK